MNVTNNYNVNPAAVYNDLGDYSIGSQIYMRSSPALLRNIITTVYLAMNALIAIIGELFLKRRNQRRLVLRQGPKAKTVPFPLLTPWLGLPNTMIYLWKARALPGGWLGWMMMATGIFSLVQHYMVNSFILPAVMPTWCDFERGIVTTFNTGIITPSPSWPAALLVFSAHTAVLANGGEGGIYDKINNTITSFQPTFHDVLGTWNCTPEPDSVIRYSDMVNTTALGLYLTTQKFLDPSTQSVGGSVLNNGTFTGFVGWSGNFDSNDSSTWGVSATIANSIANVAPVIASNFKCDLTIRRTGWTPTPMPTNQTLVGWSDIMFGFVSQVPVSHYRVQVETILNAMSILAGSGNSNSRQLPDGTEVRYGCTMNGTQFYTGIYLVFAILFLILLILLVAELYQLGRYCCNREKDKAADIPTDLLSWQLNMMRRMTGEKTLKTKDMKKWSYFLGGDEFEFKRTETLPTDSKKNKNMVRLS